MSTVIILLSLTISSLLVLTNADGGSKSEESHSWQAVTNNVFFVESDSPANLYVSKLKHGTNRLWIHAFSPDCDTLEHSILGGLILVVNGIELEMGYQCLGKKQINLYFSSSRDVDYVLGQFKRPEQVEVIFNKNYIATFKTNGFEKALKLLASSKLT